MPIVFVLALLLHVVALWLVTVRMPLMQTMDAPRGENWVTILLTPRSAEVVSPPPSLPEVPARVEQTMPKNLHRPVKERRPVAASSPPAISLPLVQQVEPRLSITDDMSTQLEAARKRRADATALANPDAADDNSIARANVAVSIGASGNGRPGNGGVFQIRHLGWRDAEFMFYGWSSNTKRNSSRLIPVEQGSSIDIQTAVIQKMIDVIREQKSDQFIWRSSRLERSITLSARPDNQAELQRFLMREFFPDYNAPAHP